MTQSSRRKFLKTASATAATLAVSHRISAWAQAAGSSTPVRVWATYRDRRYAQGEPLVWKPATEIAADAIALDPGTTRQQILGFGAALTDAACYVLSQIPEAPRAEIMHELFAPGEMALNVCRTCIGSSDYSRSVYSFDESTEPDPELKKFSIDHDKAYILPIIRQARKENPEIFLFSSPWSPPGWMKANNSMLGGAMRSHSLEPYSRYFLKFLDAYKAEGVAIDAVTLQNETDAEQNGNMPACLWAQEHEIEFVGRYLGPALRKAGGSTKIWVLDHNYNLWGRAIGELSVPGAAEYIDGIAWHGYVGEPTAMTRVHDAFPQKNAYWTEGGPDITAPDYQTDFTKWSETYNGILNNWARSITAWNVALDEAGKPNLGPFPCGGVVTVDNATKKITRSGQYWAFAHYSKHVRRGAKVFATNGIGESSADRAADPVSHSGFRNPDGSYVVVLANRGPEKRIQLLLGSQSLTLDLPAESVHTLQWS
ncbi:MAG: glycoside hydrolase family 30 beta sandwich domain-containing protein [Terracidiphilus sp.]|jgi:glucosylceramidase